MANHQQKIMEYVYHPESLPGEFQPVRIVLEPANEGKLSVTLDTEIEMTAKDIEDVLKYLENSSFNRMRINMVEDCVVIVQTGSQRCEASFNNALSAWELIPV